jgi:hypothetical protein
MKAYFETYEELLKENLPRLSGHLCKNGLTSSLYIIDWYGVDYWRLAFNFDSAPIFEFMIFCILKWISDCVFRLHLEMDGPLSAINIIVL